MTMQYQVLVQSHPDKGYIAAVLGIPDCVVEGRTKDEAVANAKAALAERLAQGEVVTIELEAPQTVHPWLRFAGTWKDDPTFDDFLAEIEAYRREVDAEENQR
jgi:predicted RNase H-like HicB family nuclease